MALRKKIWVCGSLCFLVRASPFRGAFVPQEEEKYGRQVRVLEGTRIPSEPIESTTRKWRFKQTKKLSARKHHAKKTTAQRTLVILELCVASAPPNLTWVAFGRQSSFRQSQATIASSRVRFRA